MTHFTTDSVSRRVFGVTAVPILLALPSFISCTTTGRSGGADYVSPAGKYTLGFSPADYGYLVNPTPDEDIFQHANPTFFFNGAMWIIWRDWHTPLNSVEFERILERWKEGLTRSNRDSAAPLQFSASKRRIIRVDASEGIATNLTATHDGMHQELAYSANFSLVVIDSVLYTFACVYWSKFTPRSDYSREAYRRFGVRDRLADLSGTAARMYEQTLATFRRT